MNTADCKINEFFQNIQRLLCWGVAFPTLWPASCRATSQPVVYCLGNQTEAANVNSTGVTWLRLREAGGTAGTPTAAERGFSLAEDRTKAGSKFMFTQSLTCLDFSDSRAVAGILPCHFTARSVPGSFHPPAIE